MHNQHLIDFLNQQLANINVFSVKLMRYKWYAKGHHAAAIVSFSDDLLQQLRKQEEKVAKRILSIGGRPIAVMAKFLKETTLTEANADDEEQEIVTQLKSDLTHISNELKITGMKEAAEQNDYATVLLLSEWIAELEWETVRVSGYFQ